MRVNWNKEVMDAEIIKIKQRNRCFTNIISKKKLVICGWCKQETTLNFYRGRNHCNKCNRLISKNGKKELY